MARVRRRARRGRRRELVGVGEGGPVSPGPSGPGCRHFGGTAGCRCEPRRHPAAEQGLPLARTPAQKSDTPVAPSAQPEVLYKIPARIRKYVPSLTFVAALAQAPAAMVV